MKRTCLTTLFSLSLLTGVAQEADTTSLIQEVDVYAQKSAEALFDAQHVEVIDLEDIQASAVKSVNELLEYAAAVDVRQRSPFDVQSDVSIRGGTFDQTLILLNGVPMNDPQTGHHNMNLPIAIQDIQRIEVLHGGGSYRYGPYAFSGAINIITKSTATNTINIEAEAGEYNYNNFTASVSHARGNFSGRLSANRGAADGYLPNSDFTRRNVLGELTYAKENLKISLQGGWNNKGFGAQNFYTSAFPDQYEATQTYFASIHSAYATDNVLLNFNAYSRTHTDRFELYRETGDGWYNYNESAGVYIRGNDTAASWYGGPNFHRTGVEGGELNAVFTTSLGRFDIGADVRNERIVSNNLGMDMMEPMTVEGTRFFYTKSDQRLNSGVYAHHRIEVAQFEINSSLRYNYNSAFGDEILPGIQVSYAPTAHSAVYGSYNRSFRLPTFTDLYYSLGGAIGSIDLQPEYSHNYEIGYTYDRDNLRFMASGFLRDGTNMIDWVVLPNDSTNTLQAQNITELRIYGVDGEVSYDLSKLTNNYVRRISLSAAFLQSPTDEFEFQSLYALDFLAAKTSLSVSHDLGHGIGLSWQVTYQNRNGTYNDFASGIAVPYEEVVLVDVRASYTYKDFQLYVDANNLLDRVYQDRGNVLQPGRWVRAGVTYNLNY